MPIGLRGLLIAGIFATAMGSLSTAINALATSFTRDWYEPYINPASTAEQSLRAVRWATVWFSVLMIIVASTTAYLVIVHPNVRIIPIVLGILRLHLRLGARRFPLRHVHQIARQQFRQHHRDDHRLHRRRDFERSAEQHRRPFRRQTVHAAELATGDEISLVDLLRHDRHVFRGDFVPDRHTTIQGRRARSDGRPTNTTQSERMRRAQRQCKRPNNSRDSPARVSNEIRNLTRSRRSILVTEFFHATLINY